MPNYSLTIDSKFEPFSFERYIQPYQLYGEAYKEQEEALEEIAEKADEIKGKLNKDKDAKAYKVYEDFTRELEARADELATQGMSVATSKALHGLRRRRGKELNPILEAWNRRAEQIKEQKLNGDDIIYNFSAADASLDDYIDNPSLDYKRIDGESVRQRVFQEASALAKELRNDPQRLKALVGGDYYEYIQRHGFSTNEILLAITNDAKASKVLTEMIDKAVKSSGVEAWNNAAATERVRDYASRGLWGAVGGTDAQALVGWRNQANVEFAGKMALQKNAQAFEAGENAKDRAFKERMTNKQIAADRARGNGSNSGPSTVQIGNNPNHVTDGKWVYERNNKGELKMIDTAEAYLGKNNIKPIHTGPIIISKKAGRWQPFTGDLTLGGNVEDRDYLYSQLQERDDWSDIKKQLETAKITGAQGFLYKYYLSRRNKNKDIVDIVAVPINGGNSEYDNVSSQGR